MGRIIDNWALLLLIALAVLLITLIFDTRWPVAYVYVVSTPSGAAVSDGQGYLWSTPASIPVQQEGLPVSLSHPGRVPVDTLLLPEMSRVPVLVTLPYEFSIHVLSRPSGATVAFDGSFAGRTPVDISAETPGMHQMRLTTEDRIILIDSICLAVNEPDTLFYVLPELHDSGMLMIPAELGTGEDYLISRHEVTAGEFCRYLKALEPVVFYDSTNRWGRTDTVEELFPGDYELQFYMDETNSWSVKEEQRTRPVVGLSWRAAADYCRWLSMGDPHGLEYRLPTGEEWRTAALAGGPGPWPWGNARLNGSLLNLSDRNEGLLRRHPSIDDGFSETAPVGSFPCNGWGLFDMAGNVWEYCADITDDTTVYAMGGSWLSSMEDCRCDAVNPVDTTLGYPFVGFRLAATQAHSP